jgi:hypothetical protein
MVLVDCSGGTTPFPQSGFYASRASVNAAVKTAFTVRGRQLLLSTNGGAAKLFIIKGVDYAPTQICAGSGSASSLALSDGNQAIWSQDLPAMRRLGVNAVKVYGMAIEANDKPAPIGKWLAAAYNNNRKPIYTILSIWIPPGDVGYGANPAAVAKLGKQYRLLAQTYGANPDVMGISIGGEWNYPQYVSSPATWTKGVNPIIAQALAGLKAAGVQKSKILTTTLINDLNPDAPGNSTIVQGEKNGFPRGAFVWGFDVYNGFSNVVRFVKQNTTRPMIFSEWGEPLAQHPQPKAKPTLVRDYPNPLPKAITAWITSNGSIVYDNVASANAGMNSGSFYFEWSDEYWKAYNNPTPHQLCAHSGGNNGTNPEASTYFPSGFNDEAWYGLNALAKSRDPSKPNLMKPRGTTATLQAVWAR